MAKKKAVRRENGRGTVEKTSNKENERYFASLYRFFDGNNCVIDSKGHLEKYCDTNTFFGTGTVTWQKCGGWRVLF